ncbi:MAG: thiamine-phosphate kinase [Phycisphaerae bacterium]
MREFEFIEWIRSQTHLDPAAVPVGPGDDMAVVAWGGQRVLVAIDQVLDGVHFRLERCGPEAAGRYAMVRNLSDVAAMAALPVCAVASVALPKGMGRNEAEWLYQGMRRLGDQFNCPIVGGDVATWDQPLAVSVTILARPEGIEPVLRSGAKVGDALCVTGSLGGAWRSGRHLAFVPRVRHARLLAERYGLHAMIDISDGLAGDLGHLCRASGAGAEVQADAVPIHADVFAQLGVNPADLAAKDREREKALQAALTDGEDYDLLFALPAEGAERLLHDQPLDVPVTRIGTVAKGSNLVLVDASGRRRPMPAGGWEHST